MVKSSKAADKLQKAKIILDKDFAIAKVDERLFGSFIEQLGRAVYGGIYDPGNPNSDKNGFRLDVIDRIKKLNVPVVRYPGGNFLSGFNWEDSIGPKVQRPKRLDLAWFTTESNEFGLHEFCQWAKQVNTQVMYAVNLGTRDLDSARNVVEYANHSGGSAWSDLRKKNGAADPFGIKLWCLGNEMDGPWQIGQKTSYEYGRAANEAAKVMKWVDPTIEVVACGSSAYDMPTFGAWEMEMLDLCYDNIDYVSLHRYYQNQEQDTANFLAKSMDMDAFIKTVVSICDAVGGKKHSKKKLNLSFDEWNVWYHSVDQDKDEIARNRWGTRMHLLEDVYNFEDALLVGGMLITLLRNADRVKIACLAQLVNAIAPIMTSEKGSWAQTTYWPFMLVSKFGRGSVLQPIIQCEKYSSKEYDDVPMIDAAAVLSDGGAINVFVLNRSLDSDIELQFDMRAFANTNFKEHIFLHHDDVNAINSEQFPSVVIPQQSADIQSGLSDVTVRVPALSWNVIRFDQN